MKRMIRHGVTAASKKDRKFKRSDLRSGLCYFDHYEKYTQTYKHNNSSQPVFEMHFIFDTRAHVQYAAYADAQDWSAADLEDMLSNSIPLTEILNDWDNQAVSRLKDIPHDCVECGIYLTIYGIGNKSVTLKRFIYGDMPLPWNESPSYYAHYDTILGYLTTDPNIYEGNPTKNPTQAKKLIRAISKYLTEGL